MLGLDGCLHWPSAWLVTVVAGRIKYRTNVVSQTDWKSSVERWCNFLLFRIKFDEEDVCMCTLEDGRVTSHGNVIIYVGMLLWTAVHVEQNMKLAVL